MVCGFFMKKIQKKYHESLKNPLGAIGWVNELLHETKQYLLFVPNFKKSKIWTVKVSGPSDTVSLKNKNAKYTTAQQQPIDWSIFSRIRLALNRYGNR